MKDVRPSGLGTFSGVFTPSVLTILGIILFLRLGFVVGSAGLSKAVVIIFVANLISVLTSFSLAAIATNMKVGGGGDYYLISRTLGVEFGGAIGIVLYLAQSVSIAFYCIGFGEAVSAIGAANNMAVPPQMIAFFALFFLFVLAFAGADLATKFQYIVMVFLILALVSFYAGGIAKWDSGLLISNLAAPPVSGGSFWMLFALFFPAVTGFTQGVSMSGDLADPGRSLPLGTFIAVFVSIGVYFSVAVVFAASSPLDALASDYGVMKKTAAAGFFIDAGVISATLSSAMASFLGAPRILQSLAADKTFSFLTPFAKGVGKANNPRRGVILSLVISISVIAIGQLDLIARIVSMFFLISYGLLNYATYFEAAANSPSFRPKFRLYHRRVSLAGFLACLGVMLAIDVKTGIAAGAVLAAIYQYLKRSGGPARWADSQRSYHLQQVRANLLAAQEDFEHPRQWRPYILALSNDADRMHGLVTFSELIEGGSGMSAAVRIIPGSGYRIQQRRQALLEKLKKDLTRDGHHAFPVVITAVDLQTSLSTLMMSFGIGPVRANTVLFDYSEIRQASGDKKAMPGFGGHLKLPGQSGCNLILVSGSAENLARPGGPQSENGQIDVWWNDTDSSRLMLLLAYLMTRSGSWGSARIRLLAANYDRDNRQIMAELKEMLDDFRISAEPRVILGLDEECILETSGSSDFVFLPVIIKNNGLSVLGRFSPELAAGRFKNCAMVMAASRVDLDSEPEEGKAGELARIYDELDHAFKRAKLAQKAADMAHKAAEEAMKDVNQEIATPAQELGEKIKTLLTAEKKAADSKLRAVREEAKLAHAQQKAKDEGIEIDEK